MKRFAKSYGRRQQVARAAWVGSPSQVCCASRHGAVVLIAMVALLLASIIGGSLLKTALAQHRQVQREEIRVQADLLAEAALRRAAARLAADRDYQGEFWEIPAGEFGARHGALVEIAVNTAVGPSRRRTIAVVAEYPPEPPYRTRSSREVTVEL